MFDTIFRNRTFGARVALGIMATACLIGIGLQGYRTGQWLASNTTHLHRR